MVCVCSQKDMIKSFSTKSFCSEMSSKFSVKSGLPNNRRYSENAGYIIQSSDGGLIQNGFLCVSLDFGSIPVYQRFFTISALPLFMVVINTPLHSTLKTEHPNHTLMQNSHHDSEYMYNNITTP